MFPPQNTRRPPPKHFLDWRYIMSVQFNVVERGKPGSPETPKKFYPSIVASGKISQRDVAKRAAEMSTVSIGDTAAVVENFLTIIAQELAKGNIVQLGEFGSFWLRTETEGAETAEEVRASQIKNILVKFTPGKEFQQVLDAITFEKA
ncbi:MAG: HU family DNA-binding protein [Anaerolineales bacterium]|nr:HU family DNA-binding protein [Anaerolineales bacterium]